MDNVLTVPHAKTPSPRRKAPKPAAKPAAAKPTAKVEGVGALTMAAAAAHADFDLGKLASWSAGAPVPFAFLADTFEAVAEESKRLAIISIMVRCCVRATYKWYLHATSITCACLHGSLKRTIHRSHRSTRFEPSC